MGRRRKSDKAADHSSVVRSGPVRRSGRLKSLPTVTHSHVFELLRKVVGHSERANDPQPEIQHDWVPSEEDPEPETVHSGVPSENDPDLEIVHSGLPRDKDAEAEIVHNGVSTEDDPRRVSVRAGLPLEGNGINQEEKVDHLNGAAYELKSENSGRQQGASDAAIRYRSMYIDSQIRIQALIEENYNLVRKLEFAQGKLSAYEEMKDAVGAPREVILLPASSLSPGAAEQAIVPPKSRRTYKKCSYQHGASGINPEASA